MRRALPVFGLALAGSQAGHLIAYAARFGGGAAQMQSSGAHAYFPLAARTALGVLAATVLIALLVIALARLLSAGRLVATGPSFMSLFAIFFTVQLSIFVMQEIAEAAAAGVPADSVSAIALWGMLGQLPAAAVVAATLRWLWARVEGAVIELRSISAVQRWTAPRSIAATPAFQPAYVPLTSQLAWRTRQTRRGPPSSFNR